MFTSFLLLFCLLIKQKVKVQEAYRHKAIIHILKCFFENVEDILTICPDKFQSTHPPSRDEKEVPMQLIASSATAVSSAY